MSNSPGRVDARSPARGGPYRLRLLDGFEMACPAGAIEVAPAAERVIAYLAIHQRPCSRPRVAETLFVDTEHQRAAANLRSILHRIHKRAPGLVRTDGRRLALEGAATVDVRTLDLAIERFLHPSALGTGEPPSLEPLSAELLPGWCDDWVIAERERLRQRFLHALDLVGLFHLRHGRPADAIEAGMRAVAMEPLRESARRLLVEAHLAEGNVAEAIREYEIFRDLLATELGVEPTDLLTSLLPGSLRHRTTAP